MEGSPIPGQAPPFIWIVIIGAALLWWLWPWIERTQRALQAAQEPPPADPAERAAAAVAAAAAAAEAEALAREAEAEEDEEALAPPDLGFDPQTAFEEAYAEAARLIAEVLAVPPMGDQFTAAVSGLHALAAILDRLFQSWGSEENLHRVCRVREDSESFTKNFGRHGDSNSLQELFAYAGFKRLLDEEGRGPATQKAVWTFQQQDPGARLRGLTVRLSLHRFAELQKLRGTLRWTQSNNTAVIPKVGDGALLELLQLYKAQALDKELPAPSARERNLEAEVRIKLQERRAEAGQDLPLLLHEGLAQMARALAQEKRVRVREAREDSAAAGSARPKEVRRLLARLPLPPGFDAAHLHFTSTELPRLFGLGSSTGSTSTSMGGASKEYTEDKDAAADILAREAVGLWAARQAQDVNWPCALLCGVGAALDYTINRGFIVTVLIGYEGLHPGADAAVLSRREASKGLRRRQAHASEAAVEMAERNAAKGSFGARVRTLGAPTQDATLNRK